MVQQGQVFKLNSNGVDAGVLWAYRYRTGGRGSKRVQRGGFASEDGARAALERALEKLRRDNRLAKPLTLAELVEQYLAQHDAAPVTLEKLQWLLAKAVAAFGDQRLGELRSSEIAAWRMTIPPGYPLRGNPSAAAGARTSDRLGNARCQSGQARGREPAATANREAPVRVMGRA
jgi:hypothetical protein